MSRTLESVKFQKTFDAYFWRLWMIIGILYFLAFSVYTILILNLDSKAPSFLGWIDIFVPWMNNVVFGAIGVGFISVGAIAVGIVAIGAFSVGIIAIGAGTSYGYATANSKLAPRGRFDIGKVLGIVAVGPESYGCWTLCYTGKSRYMFSPNRQDTEATELFTRWLPQFKKTFS